MTRYNDAKRIFKEVFEEVLEIFPSVAIDVADAKTEDKEAEPKFFFVRVTVPLQRRPEDFPQVLNHTTAISATEIAFTLDLYNLAEYHAGRVKGLVTNAVQTYETKNEVKRGEL